jgi:hypothetical protein
MKKCPLTTVLNWLRLNLPKASDPTKRIAAIIADLDAHALRMWREGHYTFFVLILMSIVELRRFLKAVAAGDHAAANRHLDRASTLMLGSGAAMRVAGDVNHNSYADAVVPSMKKANPKFSGSDSPDHGALIDTYKEIEKVAGNLPVEVQPAYNRFLSSVRTAIGAHVYVCAFHRGEDRPSTGSGSATKLSGVETLKRIGAHWLKLLTSRKGAGGNKCPFHS